MIDPGRKVRASRRNPSAARPGASDEQEALKDVLRKELIVDDNDRPSPILALLLLAIPVLLLFWGGVIWALVVAFR